MAAPTLLDYAESNWTDAASTSEVTDDLDWSGSGDIVVALGATEDNGNTLGTPTATGLTFAAMSGSPTNTGSSCKAYAWSATASSNSNSTVTSTTDGATAGRGIAAWAWSGSAGLGTPVVDVGTGITVNVTVAQDSAVVMVLADWNATADVTVTTVPAGGTIREANTPGGGGRCTFLVVEWQAQSAGTRAYGVSAWTGTGTVSKIAVEVQGTASGTPITGADTGAGTDASSLSVSLPRADTGAGTDASSLAVGLPRADTGAGTDASALAVAVTGGDAGTFTDTASASAGTPVGGGDTGTGGDTAGVTVFITVGDGGTGTDTSSLDTGPVGNQVFTPPTIDDGMDTTHPLFRYYKLKRGVTVLVSGSTVTQTRWPEQESLDNYDYVYLGGHVHPVSAAEVAILTAAGYAAYITEG